MIGILYFLAIFTPVIVKNMVDFQCKIKFNMHKHQKKSFIDGDKKKLYKSKNQ